jgi:hypothetical protein
MPTMPNRPMRRIDQLAQLLDPVHPVEEKPIILRNVIGIFVAVIVIAFSFFALGYYSTVQKTDPEAAVQSEYVYRIPYKVDGVMKFADGRSLLELRSEDDRLAHSYQEIDMFVSQLAANEIVPGTNVTVTIDLADPTAK